MPQIDILIATDKERRSLPNLLAKIRTALASDLETRVTPAMLGDYPELEDELSQAENARIRLDKNAPLSSMEGRAQASPRLRLWRLRAHALRGSGAPAETLVSRSLRDGRLRADCEDGWVLPVHRDCEHGGGAFPGRDARHFCTRRRLTATRQTGWVRPVKVASLAAERGASSPGGTDPSTSAHRTGVLRSWRRITRSGRYVGFSRSGESAAAFFSACDPQRLNAFTSGSLTPAGRGHKYFR